MKHFFVLTAVSVSFSTLALAQTERDLESHVHGAAALNVAIDESSVFIELNTPWNNLVGFEHAPETDEQHAMVDDALKQLNDPAKLFLFDAGDCTLDEVAVENTMSSDAHDDDHDKEHDDAHGDEHDKEHDDAHGDEHGDEHAEESGTHSAVLANYSYTCNQIDKLSHINLYLFSIWSGFEDIDVQLIGAGGQALAELNPANPILNLETVK